MQPSMSFQSISVPFAPGEYQPVEPVLPPAYATSVSLNPRTDSSEIGRAGLQGSVTRSAEAAAIAANTSAASQARRWARPAPFEMPVAYTRRASTQAAALMVLTILRAKPTSSTFSASDWPQQLPTFQPFPTPSG